MKKKAFLIFEIEEFIVALSAVVLIAGAFFAWGQTPNYSALGINGDGLITIGLGALAILFLIIDLISEKIPPWVPLIFGILALAIGLIDYNAISTKVEPYNGSVGPGIYLTLIASLGIITGSILDIYRSRK
ncbi:MAG: hypothetical protein WC873_01490 [Candidatus Gracilibacteria bacterium]